MSVDDVCAPPVRCAPPDGRSGGGLQHHGAGAQQVGVGARIGLIAASLHLLCGDSSRDDFNKRVCNVVIAAAELLQMSVHPDQCDVVLTRYFKGLRVDCERLSVIVGERGLSDSSLIAPEWLPYLWAE